MGVVSDILLNGGDKKPNETKTQNDIYKKPSVVGSILSPVFENYKPTIAEQDTEGSAPANIDFNIKNTLDINPESDWINTMKNAWDQVQLSGHKIKKYNNEFTIDKNVDRRKTLDYLLQHNAIDEKTYTERIAELEAEDLNAASSIQTADEDILTNEKEMESNPVSKIYQLKQAISESKGADKTFTELMKFDAPSGIGSMGALMGQQAIAMFGRAGLKKLAASAATGIAQGAIGGPAAEITVPVATIANVVATLSQIAIEVNARYGETQSELGDAVSTSREKLLEKWTAEHPNQEPTEEDLRQIRMQSMKGTDEMFWQQMSLVVPDIIGGTLASSLFKGSNIIKGLDKVGTYNKYTRGAKALGAVVAGTELEKFEEGYQFVSAKRQQNEALGLNEYTNKGFIKDFLSDASDVMESISLNPIPGGTYASAGGRYANDKEFQNASEAGGLLGFFGGAAVTSMSITKDINKYIETQKELSKTGAINLDSKVFKLKNDVYLKHFENDTVHFLLEGIRNLKDSKDENGVPLMSEEIAREEIRNIADAYENYKKVSKYVDNITPKGGLGFKFTPEQKQELATFKSVLFNNSIEKTKLQKSIAETSTELEHSQINTPIGELNNRKLSLLSNKIEKQKEIIDAIEAIKSNKDLNTIYDVDFRLEVANKKLASLNKQKDILTDELVSIGYPINNDYNLTIDELNYNSDLVTKEFNLAVIDEDGTKNVKNNPTLSSWYKEYQGKREAKSTIIDDAEAKAAKAEAAAAKKQQEEEVRVAKAAEKTAQEESDKQARADVERQKEEDRLRQEAEDLANTNSFKIEDIVFTKGQAIKLEDLEGNLGDFTVFGVTKNADNSIKEVILNNEEGEFLIPFESFNDLFINGKIQYEDITNVASQNVDANKLKQREALISAFSDEQEDVSLEPSEDPKTPKSNTKKEREQTNIIFDILDSLNIDSSKVTFPDIYNYILELPEGSVSNAEFLPAIFNRLKKVVALIQTNKINEETTLKYYLNDDLTISLVPKVKTNIPFTTDKAYKSNESFQENLRQGRVTDNVIEGNKIESILSVARVDVKYKDTEGPSQYNDRFVNGELQLNDLNVLNTELTPVNSTLLFKVDTGFDSSRLNDTDYVNSYPISIYAVVDGNEVYVGKVHDPSYINANKMAESLTPEELAEQKETLIAVRKEMLSNPTETFTSKINYKAFGYVNSNQKGNDKTLGNSFGNDNRIQLGVKVDEKETVTRKVEIYGKSNLVNGSVFVLLPHPSGVYMPWYVSIKSLGNDKVNGQDGPILKTVLEGFNKFFQTGNLPQSASDYLFVTEDVNVKQTLSTVLLNKETGTIYLLEKPFTKDSDPAEFKQAVERLFINVSTKKLEDKDYIKSLWNSPLITSNVKQNSAVVNDKQVYSYFSQTTVNYDVPSKLNVDKTNIASDSVTDKDIADTKEEEVKKAFEELGIDESQLQQLSESEEQEDVTIIDNTSLDLISEEYNEFIKGVSIDLQQEMTTSVSYLLLTNKKEAESKLTNKESVKQAIQDKYNNFKTIADNDSNETNKKVANKFVNNLQLLLDNYDVIFIEAEEELKLLNVKKDDTTGFYEEQETLEEGVDNWNDESSLTQDRASQAPANVKKFLYFTPELFKGSKGYTPKLNNLGFQSQANYKDIYVKLSEEISQKYYSSDKLGYDNMLADLIASKNPYINYVATQLSKANENVKQEFFKALYQQHSNYQQLLTYNTKSKKDYNSSTYTRIENTDRSGAKGKIVKSWEEKSKRSSLYKSEPNPLTGNKELYINTAKGKELLDRLTAIANNNDNFESDATTSIKEEPLTELLSILKEVGIEMDKRALFTFFNKEKVGGKRNQQSLFKDIFINKLFKRFAGEAKVEVDDFNEKGSLYKVNNAFDKEKSILFTLANYQYDYVAVSNESSRIGDKTFYAYTRHTPISELKLKLKDKNFAAKKLAEDAYASTSIYLKNIAEGNTKFVNLFSFDVNKGSKITSDKNSENVEVKDQIEKMHELNKIHAFQSSTTVFYSDTYSDKSQKVTITAPKQEVKYTGSIDTNLQLDSSTLDLLYNYFLNEYNRILLVESNKDLRKIKGFTGDKGTGRLFFTYSFLNKDILKEANNDLYLELYDSEGNISTNISNETKEKIKQEINKDFSELFKDIKADWKDLNIYSEEVNGNKVQAILNFDQAYTNSIAKKLNINHQAIAKNAKNYSQEVYDLKQQLFDYAVVDYVVNYAINSNEMLMLTGDPAQHAKGKGSVDNIIKQTFINVSKRNARLAASGDKKVWDKSEYNTVFVADTSIDSEHVDSYVRLLKGKVEAKDVKDAYNGHEKESDAEELTTVEEHLADLKSDGTITSAEEKMLLAKWDKKDFNKKYPGETVNVSSAELDKVILQPRKPVQIYSKLENGLSREYYIKTSAIPLIPEIVKGTEMEKVLEAMKDNNVNRLAFASGVKLGLTGTEKSLFDDNGKFNPASITKDSIHTLSRDGFSIQLNVPYDSIKDYIREGTQLSKLLFQDLNEGLNVTFQGKQVTVGELKKLFRDLHTKIVQKELTQLLEDIGAEVNPKGEYKITDSSKLSEILIKEGKGRGYNSNSLIGLKINPKTGTFNIPLTFLSNNAQVEPIITALLTNKLTKIKLPGKSYVQASEVIFRKRNVKELEDLKQEDVRNIICTKPEYKNVNKLGYIDIKDNKVTKAQILMPSYFVHNGVKLNIKDFVKADGTLDIDRIPEELLTITGFRIPTQGRNSMMVFEVIGFLPEVMGDTIIVPSEIAAQMGSDYDVDKLYTYHLGYEYNDKTKSFKAVKYNDSSNDLLDFKSGIVEITQALLTTPEVVPSMLIPQGFDNLKDAIETVNKIKDNKNPNASKRIRNYSPIYQRKLYLDNAAGKSGLGIAANANTGHAIAQDSNLYIKGTGILFLDENGNLYNDSNVTSNRTNEHTEDMYVYMNNDETFTNQAENPNNGAWRLDKVNIFGTDRTISDIINQWLGASADNAKEKLLGEGNINDYNFNVGLLIARTGFDDSWIIPFINQPILLELYKTLDVLKDPTVKNYQSDKRNKAIAELFKKYETLANIKVQEELEFQPVSKQDLLSNIGEPVSVNNARVQLNILKAFLSYESIAKELRITFSALNTDVKGLPKNITETNDKAKKIAKLSNTNPVLGNVLNLKNKSVISGFQNIPRIANELFSTDNNGNYIYHYDSPAYQYVKEQLLKLTNTDEFSTDDLNEIHNNIYQFILTSIIENPNQVRKDLTIGENNIYDKFIKLEAKAKNKNNYLLQNLNLVSSYNPNDPKKLELISEKSEVDIFERKLNQSWLNNLLSKNTDGSRTEESIFAEELILYTITSSSQPFGSSNLLKHLPYSYLDKIGFSEKINKLDFNDDILSNFVQQFIQHIPEYTKLVKETQISNTVYKSYVNDKNEKVTTKVIDAFTLPEISFFSIIGAVDNKATDLVVKMLDGELTYPKYLSIYSTELGFRVPYIKVDNVDFHAYRRIDKLGSNNFFEYSFDTEYQKSIIDTQKTNLANPNVEVKTPGPKETKTLNETIVENYFTKPTINSLLNQVILDNDFSDDPILKGYSETAKKLLEFEDLGYTIELGDVNKHNVDTKTITYNPKNSLFFDTDKNYIKSRVQETILHEILHAYTVSKIKDSFVDKTKLNKTYDSYIKYVQSNKQDFLDAEIFKALYENRGTQDFSLNDLGKAIENLDNLTKFAADIKKKTNSSLSIKDIVSHITNEFKDNIKVNKEKFYAYVKLEEFVTMSFVNKGMQEYLKQIDSLTPDASINYKNSLWEDFLNSIIELLGFNRTLLNDALESIIDLIATNNYKTVTKEEFLKSLEEDIEVTENNDIKLGAQELFNSNPELTKIGTVEQYSQYLNTIFPDSKVKDIVYRGKTESQTNKKSKELGIFFTDNKNAANIYAIKYKGDEFDDSIIQGVVNKFGLNPTIEQIKSEIAFFEKMGATKEQIEKNAKEFQDYIQNNKGISEQAILNIKNPKNLTVKDWFDNYDNSNKLKENSDGLLLRGGKQLNNRIYDVGENQIVVFEPEQIHILGSKQDIEGFKKFTNNKQNNDIENLEITVKIGNFPPIKLTKRTC